MPEPGGDSVSTTGFPTPTMVGSSFGMEHVQISSLSSAISDLSNELKGLQTSLGRFNTFSANPFNNVIHQIENQANSALSAVNELTGAVEGAGAMAGGGGRPGGNTGMGNFLATGGSQGIQSPLIKLGMMPIEWLRDRVGVNRNVSLASSQAFAQIGRQQGVDIADIMSQVGRFPGQVQGTPTDLMQLFGTLPSLGASFGFGGQAGQGVRARGMLAGVREAQLLNPGEQVSSIIQNVGGFAANTGAQQQAQMLTGGAFGMIGAGGRQKSLSQWAEDILRWLEGLRGGGDRGKPFTYGELMAQYFPGSNIDAWFQANGVPPGMREYWWTYALQKANKTGSTGGSAFQITPDPHSIAQARLGATTELTRTEMNVGAKMTPQYVTRESMNTWFNKMMGSVQESVFKMLLGPGGMGNLIQYLPDTIEEMLFGGLQMGAGAADSALQSFGGIGNLIQMLPMLAGGAAAVADVEGWPAGVGDIGDIGGYTTTGGTGLAGLSPNMRSKLGPMLKANPRLRVTSGFRDNAMQKRLKDRGYSRVSGKPSAHTRGDAADLGPSTEYPWIVANAKKFGLRSGMKAGEPWHVGTGDVGDILGSIGGAIGGAVGGIGGSILGAIPGLDQLQMLFKLLGTVTSMFGSGANFGGAGMLGSLLPAFGGLAMGQGAGGLLSALGGLGQGESGAVSVSQNLLSVLLGPLAGLAGGSGGSWGSYPDQDMAKRLATQTITLGGLPSNILSGGGLLGGLGGGILGGGILGGGILGGGGLLGGLGSIAGGALSRLGSSASSLLGGNDTGFEGVPSERAITAARLASQYWHGEDLIKAVAISGRESSWDPSAHRTTTRPKNPAAGDRGLYQINYVNDPTMISKGLYSKPTDLFDPAINTRVAYELWKTQGWRPWSMTASGWQAGGDPMAGAKVEEARAAIHSAGVGDVERMQYENAAMSQGGSSVQFHISGNTISVSDQAARNLLGGGGTQIDIRRTVTLIADYLEDEMNRRMARSN